MSDYQFIFRWAWPLWGFKRLRRKDGDLALVYDWIFWIGPIEIRKWAKWVRR